MDTISSPHPARRRPRAVTPRAVPRASAAGDHPVAAVMRRVHAELSTGALPSVDVLLLLPTTDVHRDGRRTTTAA
jgi:hypothetical protein